FKVGEFVDDNGDLDGDGIVNLVEYAYGFSPLAHNPFTAGMQTSVAPGGPTITFTVVFRRDPRATDLTYRLQTSDDLVNWTTITESVGGATPSGTGFVSESDAPGESPIKLVTAREMVTTNDRYARLLVIRTP
ncbi:MAG TPA: hypothetical protein VG095_06365, partial [Chthoniobacterales bacterium]|nr:hypothetical protein [Chthoniobacterales bacterium]